MNMCLKRMVEEVQIDSTGSDRSRSLLNWIMNSEVP